MRGISGLRIVTPDGVLDDGWCSFMDARIDELGSGEPPFAPPPGRRAGGWLLPGFVDMHVHGGGGAAFTSHDQDEVARAATFHRGCGSTTMLASLVTAPVAELERSVALLAELTEQGLVAGTHLEGPFLASLRCGAQDPRYLIDPDPQALERLFRVGRGTVRMVTVAPELPGATDLIRRIVEAGVVAAVGHTDASYEQTLAAFDAGATVATHLYNGMRPFHHRAPGPVGAALAHPEVVCELISDGVHLHPAVVRQVLSTVGPQRVALITDAMAAAGLADGAYMLGALDVTVSGGVAMLSDGSSIAGSTMTMASCVRTAVLDAGLSVEAASVSSSATPGRVIGSGQHAIQAGAPADLVLLGEDFRLQGVIAGGEWVTQPGPCCLS